MHIGVFGNVAGFVWSSGVMNCGPQQTGMSILITGFRNFWFDRHDGFVKNQFCSLCEHFGLISHTTQFPSQKDFRL